MCSFETITICALIEDVVFADARRRPLDHIDILLAQEYHLPEDVCSVLCELWDSTPSAPAGDAAKLLYSLDRYGLRLPTQSAWAPLRSVFGTAESGWFRPGAVCSDEFLHCPEKLRTPLSDACLDALCSNLRQLCTRLSAGEHLVSALFDFLEDHGSFLSPDDGAHSLFETAKLRAGGAACLFWMMQEQTRAATPEEIFRQPFVLVCSLDFLGIKDFKFQEAYDDELSLVVAASFYVDLFRENLLDDFLDCVGLYRCNVIFSGGRHLHLFLPNTAKVRNHLSQSLRTVNDWLAAQFGLSLYVSCGICAIDGLLDLETFDSHYYLDIFTEIANQKALMEAHKYTADNLVQIGNSLRANEDLAHRSWMQSVADCFSDEVRIAVRDVPGSGIPIAPGRFASVWNGDTKGLVRLYGEKGSCRRSYPKVRQIGIWHQAISCPAFQIEPDTEGRYGLFRMDIDNFRSNMLSCSRSDLRAFPAGKMEHSRQLAYFLRRDVPCLLRRYLDSQASTSPVVLSVIHEGADDMFIFGEFGHLLRFTSQMYLHYREFTLGCGSFSAGICLYDFQKPLLQNAQTAQQLLDLAKTVPGKNAVVIQDSSGVFSWEDLIHHGTDNQNHIV